MKKRRNFSAAFKTKVALEAIKNEHTLAELAQIHDLHPNMMTKWKKEVLDNMQGIFEGSVKSLKNKEDAEKETLHKRIGELQIQVDFLKRLPGLHSERKRGWA